MSGARQELLDVECVQAKGGACFGLASPEGGVQVRRIGHGARSASSPSGDGFQHDPAAADPGHELPCLLQRNGVVEAPRHGHTGSLRRFAGAGLVAEQGKQLRCRADEDPPRFIAGAREISAFRQEAVARMDCVTAGLQ